MIDPRKITISGLHFNVKFNSIGKDKIHPNLKLDKYSKKFGCLYLVQSPQRKKSFKSTLNASAQCCLSYQVSFVSVSLLIHWFSFSQIRFQINYEFNGVIASEKPFRFKPEWKYKKRILIVGNCFTH
jgi:hypothetical protein